MLGPFDTIKIRRHTLRKLTELIFFATHWDMTSYVELCVVQWNFIHAVEIAIVFRKNAIVTEHLFSTCTGDKVQDVTPLSLPADSSVTWCRPGTTFSLTFSPLLLHPSVIYSFTSILFWRWPLRVSLLRRRLWRYLMTQQRPPRCTAPGPPGEGLFLEVGSYSRYSGRIPRKTTWSRCP